MDFAIFRRNFDEILPEFHRIGQEMTKCLEILKKMREKFGKWQKFPDFVRNFIRSFHFFNPILIGYRSGCGRVHRDVAVVQQHDRFRTHLCRESARMEVGWRARNVRDSTDFENLWSIMK